MLTSPRKVQALFVSFATITLAALTTPVTVASADSDCPPLQITPLHTAPQQPVFTMRPGRLRPQLESLLRHHLSVDHVVWLVANEHEWPAHFDLTGTTWESILEALAASYQLRIQLHANRTAVVSYLGSGEEDL